MIKENSIQTKFLKFCIVGGSGALLNFILTFALTDWIGLWYMLSLFIATVIAVIWNFTLNYYWTFTTQKKYDDPDYDWQAYFNGNPIQKWWKHNLNYKIANMVEGRRILDVGCGSSPLCTLMTNKEYIGIDVNDNKIQFMRNQNLDGAKFNTCSIEQLSFNVLNIKAYGNAFDTVICSEVIEHIETQKEALLLVRTLNRISKPGGVIIIATPNYDSRIWRIIEKAYKLLMPQAYGDGHVLQFGETELIELCRQTGLQHEITDMVLGADMICKFRKVKDID